MTTSNAPRRRRKAGWIVGAVVVVLVALMVGAEVVARTLAPTIIRDQLVANLGLAEDQQIDVGLPGPVLLPYLVVGSLTEMTLSAQDVEVEGLTGDVEVALQDVPVWGGTDWSGGQARVTLDEAQMRALLGQADGFPVDSFSLDDPEVALDTELELFGQAIPLGVRLEVGAEEGDILLSPTTFLLAGTEISADALRQQAGPLLGSFAEQWPVCIAEYLPAALTLTDVAVDGATVVADFEIDSAILRDASAQQSGTCD
ncbi:LmeA family phospholipid-binding protein [Microbacterium dauci]|uniref:LmeA family phospholipid-binding protein n=1 Tax=Microbacterium dauci TaxID=3048008 RepID=A0ABT6ZBG3_9MICO|nr:LmeA family phospholipid-binding protein [Microbacterium sp. LX3-4]MDJ1113025.1 LmeA family phospholipid-binding protein [Microbacterium sp. LX3-4]